jgi:hypothetical protein
LPEGTSPPDGSSSRRCGLDHPDGVALGVVEEADHHSLHDLLGSHHPCCAKALGLRQGRLNVGHLDVEGDATGIALGTLPDAAPPRCPCRRPRGCPLGSPSSLLPLWRPVPSTRAQGRHEAELREQLHLVPVEASVVNEVVRASQKLDAVAYEGPARRRYLAGRRHERSGVGALEDELLDRPVTAGQLGGDGDPGVGERVQPGHGESSATLAALDLHLPWRTEWRPGPSGSRSAPRRGR